MSGQVTWYVACIELVRKPLADCLGSPTPRLVLSLEETKIHMEHFPAFNDEMAKQMAESKAKIEMVRINYTLSRVVKLWAIKHEIQVK